MTRRRWRNERGAVAVEFALVFPLLILVLFGVVEYGAVYNAQLLVTGAAREAAREMAVTGNAGSATAAALTAAPGLVPALTSGDIDFSGACAPGTDVTVTISYAKPFITGMFGATVDLTGTATRRCGG
ncbi:MAG: TadE/TadG family type IV pilus assembly protein [Pseudolysinimonas sp.]